MRLALVCLDESERSDYVLSYAKDFAERYRASLCLLRVLVPPDGLTLPGVTHSPEVTIDEHDTLAELNQLAEQVPVAFRGTTTVVIGEPWRLICRSARELAVDIILVGAHRAHGLERVFGTTASHVTRHADRSVLVVRPKPRE